MTPQGPPASAAAADQRKHCQGDPGPAAACPRTLPPHAGHGPEAALLDSEHIRRSIGEVAVPFGVCAEPSNVKAGGTACPYRFRCAGCDHFRTDVSYLPDLQAYLDDLLRNRERVLAATDIDRWARAEAMPSAQEITRIRRLITRIQGDVDQLTADERAEIGKAVTAIRRHRTTMLGMPRIRPAAINIRPEQTA
jgi:hypothetical protein